MPSLSNSGGGVNSSLTWDQACSRIAKVASGAGDPDNALAASECLEETFQMLSSRKDWKFLLLTSDPITLVSGQTDYDLPARFRKPYDAYLTGQRTPLQFNRRRDSDLTMGGAETAPTMTPRFYDLYNTPSTGKVSLFPVPNNPADGPVVVRYYREFNIPASGGDPLDIPMRYEQAVLALARADYLAMKGDESVKVQYWARKSQQALLWMIADDNTVPDENLVMQPLHTLPGWYNPNDTRLWTNDWWY